MLKAFSKENHGDSKSFDWNEHYGKGFDCLNLARLSNGGDMRFKIEENKCTLFYVNGSIPNWRVSICLNYLFNKDDIVKRRLRVMSKPKVFFFYFSFVFLINGCKDTKDPLFLKINPRGKTPVVVDKDGVIVYESMAILLHLQKKYDEKNELLGKDSTTVFRYMMESENITHAYKPIEKLFEWGSLPEEKKQKAKNALPKIMRELQLWEDYLGCACCFIISFFFF